MKKLYKKRKKMKTNSSRNFSFTFDFNFQFNVYFKHSDHYYFLNYVIYKSKEIVFSKASFSNYPFFVYLRYKVREITQFLYKLNLYWKLLLKSVNLSPFFTFSRIHKYEKIRIENRRKFRFENKISREK